MRRGKVRRGRLSAAWLLPAVALLAWGVAYALAFDPPPGQPALPPIYLVHGVPYLAFAAVGGLVIRSDRAARVGWAMAGIGVLQGLATASSELMRHLAVWPSGRTAAGWVQVVLAPLPIAATGLIVVLLLLFPDGRLPSRRWRWFLWTIATLLLMVVVEAVTTPLPPPEMPDLPVSPLAAPAVAAALAPFTSFAAFPAAVLVAAASLLIRYRRGSPIVRQQVKWLALAAVALAACEAGNIALGDAPLSGVLDALGKLAVVAAIGIAVLRHRLYDVDLAISRALAYGMLAALVTVIYVVLVVVVGAEVGRGGEPDLGLSVLATVVVALVSLPLRVRLQEMANRLVYGRRQAPYDSLTGFTQGLADRYRVGDVLPAIAAALGEGLRARAVTVELAEGDGLQPAQTWPPGVRPPDSEPDERAPITHQGHLLGSLAIWSDVGLTDAERRLLTDLARQAGLVVHNARLSEELERRLEQLRASRLRLVSAQDMERRRFERDLHDGAQQDLVTLRMKLGEAERAARGDPALSTLIAEGQEHTGAALESIRRLSRGLCPPLLQSHGLVAALVAHVRRLPLPVDVHGTDARLPTEIETAVYFCCVEALQNVVKHAGAQRARVDVECTHGELRFEVADDGRGMSPEEGREGSGLLNMTDRVEALGGRLTVASGRSGTRVRGRVPVELAVQAGSAHGPTDETGSPTPTCQSLAQTQPAAS